MKYYFKDFDVIRDYDDSVYWCYTSTKDTGGAGTYLNPYGQHFVTTIPGGKVILLDSGLFDYLYMDAGGNLSGFLLRGISKESTFINFRRFPGGNTSNGSAFDMTILGGGAGTNNGNQNPTTMYRCIFTGTLFQYGNPVTLRFQNCILKTAPYALMNYCTFLLRNSYESMVIDNAKYLASTGQLFANCDVDINIGFLGNYGNYAAFDNCRYKMTNNNPADETEYTYLVPTDSGGNIIVNPNANDYKAEFVRRCQLVGLDPNQSSGIYLSRWLLCKDSSYNGEIYVDSEIDKWELSELIRVGYSNTRALEVKIIGTGNLKNSISANNPNNGDIKFSDGQVTFIDGTDINTRVVGQVSSNIIALNSRRVIDKVLTPNNFPADYGMIIDSEDNLSFEESDKVYPLDEKINADDIFILRSTDGLPATAVYNGVTYNTALASNRKNIILGVAGKTSFTVGSGNPVLYRILNDRQYQTIEMRVVNKIPAEQIKTGNLVAGYWYLVEHDNDLSNTTDYITYNGKLYYVGDSFLVSSSLTFNTNSFPIHLRRCWRDNYNKPSEETIDQAFWADEQKPKWLKVIPDDLRYLMTNNSELEVEMAKDNDSDDFEYIVSGHEAFYPETIGANGIKRPNFKIKGSYVLFRVRFSTLNNM